MALRAWDDWHYRLILRGIVSALDRVDYWNATLFRWPLKAFITRGAVESGTMAGFPSFLAL